MGKDLLLAFLAINYFVQFSESVSAQTFSKQKTSWSANLKSASAFIENKGQFSMYLHKGLKANILYAVDEGRTMIYFTSKGITYQFRNKEAEVFNSKKSEHEREEEEHKAKIITDVVNMEWLNANPDVTIVAEEQKSDYYNYTCLTKEGQKNFDEVPGFKKIIYKNLYNNIDVEYVLHPENGVKYSLILHPGADMSQVKIRYSGTKNVDLQSAGDLIISTLFGNITDHKPLTFYEGSPEKIIESHFVKEGKTVSFYLANYDNTKTVVIDPWTQTPALSNSNKVWECEKDQNGNVYIIGGDYPMKLQKYNAAGAIQWTYSTPYDTTAWLGALATDKAGNSYVTCGSCAAILKVNTSGGLVWSVNGGSMDEYWDIAFNCDETKLMVGGTRLTQPNISGSNGMIYEINTSNGAVLDFKKVAYVLPLPGSICPNEVRSISSSHNGKYYYLTFDTIGVVNENLSSCNNAPAFAINSLYEFGYKCESYRFNNSGIKAIKAGADFLYTQNGTNIQKRSLSDLSVISSTAIPGGTSTLSNSHYSVSNSGIDIDNCGNVYVGSANGVIMYDANLTFLDSVKFNFAVYDVALSNNGDVIACGAAGNVGYIKSVNMGGCSPMNFTCFNAAICSAGPFCDTTTTVVNLSSVTSGGTWSGQGITNANTGTFNTSMAGVGAHTIYHTVTGGTDSIVINVRTCITPNICKETNGNISVTNGSAPYNWEVYQAGTTITTNTQANCTTCGGTWFFGSCTVTSCTSPAGWSSFANTATATPPATVPIRVTDAFGNIAVINDLNALPSCAPLNSNETSQGLQISIHPNPSEGLFDVVLNNAKNISVLRVIDALGRIVWEEKVITNASNFNKKIDIRGNAKGIYFVQVFTSIGVKTMKISLD